jgi:anaerobic selenocysteine-containing dehydrogenase
VQQTGRGSGNYQALGWDSAVAVIRDTLQKVPAGESAFLLGLFPDHLADLVNLLSRAVGGMSVLRYSGQGGFDSRVTLMDATQMMFGAAKIPGFDFENADVIFSFGADFSEAWLAPAAFSDAAGLLRRGGYLVQFEAQRSPVAEQAAEWVRIAPGSEGLLALALGRLVVEGRGAPLPPVYAGVDLAQVAQASGVTLDEMQRLARLFLSVPRKIALPGDCAEQRCGGKRPGDPGAQRARRQPGLPGWGVPDA